MCFARGRLRWGTLGLLAPGPRQRAFGPLDSHSGGSGWVGGPARGGRAGLAGVTAHSGCAATRNMRGSPYPSRHSRDTFPSGEGVGLRALGRGSPTVAPLRVGLRAPPWLREAATSCGGRRRLLGLLRPWGEDGDKRRVLTRGSGQAAPVPGCQGAMPPGEPARPRRGAPIAHRDPRKRGAPYARRAFAQAARHPHARATVTEGP